MPPSKSKKVKKPIPELAFGNEPMGEDAKTIWNKAHDQIEERDRTVHSLGVRVANLEAGYSIATRAVGEACIMAQKAMGLDGNEQFKKDAARWQTFFENAAAQIRAVING